MCETKNNWFIKQDDVSFCEILKNQFLETILKLWNKCKKYKIVFLRLYLDFSIEML